MRELQADNLNDLYSIADELLVFAKGCRFFIFEGEMGAGKTTFIKALCLRMGVTETIGSPTFSIVNEYLGDTGAIYHFDFYRLKDIGEAFDLGYEDYFYSNNYCLVEWPQKIQQILPDTYVKVSIKTPDYNKRIFSFEHI